MITQVRPEKGSRSNMICGDCTKECAEDNLIVSIRPLCSDFETGVKISILVPHLYDTTTILFIKTHFFLSNTHWDIYFKCTGGPTCNEFELAYSN